MKRPPGLPAASEPCYGTDAVVYPVDQSRGLSGHTLVSQPVMAKRRWRYSAASAFADGTAKLPTPDAAERPLVMSSLWRLLVTMALLSVLDGWPDATGQGPSLPALIPSRDRAHVKPFCPLVTRSPLHGQKYGLYGWRRSERIPLNRVKRSSGASSPRSPLDPMAGRGRIRPRTSWLSADGPDDRPTACPKSPDPPGRRLLQLTIPSWPPPPAPAGRPAHAPRVRVRTPLAPRRPLPDR